VVGGDWNVVENGRDKSSREGRIISNGESFKLELLKAHLHVQDYFKYDNLLTYSWDNHRTDNNRVLARLDRFYIFPNRNGIEDHHILEYNIMGDCGISDHLPVSCIIELLQEKAGGSKYKVNGAYLTDPQVVAELEKLWKESPATAGFFGKMRRILKWYKEMCLTKARQRRAQEKELRDRLVIAQAALQRDPVNISYQETVEEILDELRTFEDWKTAGIRTRSALRKRATGNKATKEFYESVQPRNTQTSLTKLLDNGGTIRTSQSELESMCFDFYSGLYSSIREDGEIKRAQEEVSEGTPKSLTEEMCTSFKRPVTLSELTDVLNAMASHKSPGLDGVTTEFFKALWPVIGSDYLTMIQESINRGSLPQGVTTGLITLLHKGGGRSSLDNWHPITLLNVSYKIFAKALQGCAKGVPWLPTCFC
jgi:hypothetical protein